ncbi:MAG: HD-GYP domain-containing protein [Actinomycetota bacterium]
MGPAGGETFATSPTELRRYLGHAVVATCVIAGLPLVLVLGLGSRLGPVATLISMGLSIGLAQLGNALWQRHPGSKDVVFNDLMLWGYLRRIRSRRGLSKKVERLGIGSGKVQGRVLSVDEQTRLLKRLAIALESGDPYTHGHSQRVARHAYMIAKAMKLPRAERETIRLAGILHDVGKLRIPKDIINKPGALTDAQYDIIKTHSLVGAKMVSILDDPEVTRMVRQHHERLDGSGYPDKLAGNEISLGARILAVADTFDATSSQRPYRAAQPHKVSIDILKSEAGRKLDAKVVDAFVAYYSGKRSFKWWAFASVVPAHVRDLTILLAQRVGAAGIANAAVVGATAVALTPVAATPVVKFDRAAQRPRVAVAANAERAHSVANPGNSVLGDKLARHPGSRNGADKGKKVGHDRHHASLGKGRDGRGKDGDGISNGTHEGDGPGDNHGESNGESNGHGSVHGPAAPSAGSVTEDKPDKTDMGTNVPGQPTDGTDGTSSGSSGSGGGKDKEDSGSDDSSGPGSGDSSGSGSGDSSGSGSGDSGSGSSGSGDSDSSGSGSGDSGSDSSGSGSGDSSGDGGSEPAPEESSGPGNSDSAPGHGGSGNGNGGGKSKLRR